MFAGESRLLNIPDLSLFPLPSIQAHSLTQYILQRLNAQILVKLID